MAYWRCPTCVYEVPVIAYLAAGCTVHCPFCFVRLQVIEVTDCGEFSVKVVPS